MYYYKTNIISGGSKRLINCVENILLRPNDSIKLLGEDKFAEFIQAVENILDEQYIDTDIYKYYYTLNTVDHGFCTFERWKLGLLY